MNKTNICWCDYTWNPVTGCHHGCPYCSAEKMAKRLRGRAGYPADEPFKPMFHPHRLNEPAKVKKPSRIFVSSMGDLFGDWVDDAAIQSVFRACKRAPQHRYFFLTKNPYRYLRLPCHVPDNGYLGASITTAIAARKVSDNPMLDFISIEPLLEDVAEDLEADNFRWIIIGAQTRPDRRPPSDWVNNILAAAGDACTPVWCKDNLRHYWPDLPQERESER